MPRISRFEDAAIGGLGLVCALGSSPSEILGRLRNNEPGIRPLTAFDLVGATAGEAPEFDLRSRLRKPKGEKLMSRATRLAMFAASDAVRSWGGSWEMTDRNRAAVEVGSGHTGIDYDEFFPALQVAWEGKTTRILDFLDERASRLIDAYCSLRSLSNAGVGLLSAEYDLHGPSNNYVQEDCASAWALAAAAEDLEDSSADIVLAGGYDSLLVKGSYLAFAETGLVPFGGVMKPFGRGLAGLTLGEGAAFFILESEQRIRARGQEPLARLEAFLSGGEFPGEGWLGDGLPALEPELRAAFDSGLRPDYVVARGLGTNDDRSEASVLSRLGVPSNRVTAWKGWTGYSGAATSAVEVALTIHTVREGFLPSPLAGADAEPTLDLSGFSDQALAVVEDEPLILFLAGTLSGQASALWVRVKRNAVGASQDELG